MTKGSVNCKRFIVKSLKVIEKREEVILCGAICIVRHRIQNIICSLFLETVGLYEKYFQTGNSLKSLTVVLSCQRRAVNTKIFEKIKSLCKVGDIQIKSSCNSVLCQVFIAPIYCLCSFIFYLLYHWVKLSTSSIEMI